MTVGRELPVQTNGTHVAWPYMFPNGHSVTCEWNYSSPFSSVWSAWKLRWEVLQDDFEHGLSGLHGVQLAPQCLGDEITSILVNSQEPRSKLRPCRKVWFDDCIELAIGSDDEYHIYRHFVEHVDLQEWSEKPWQYMPSSPSGQYSWRKLTNFSYPFCDLYKLCEDEAVEEIRDCFQVECGSQGTCPVQIDSIRTHKQDIHAWIHDLQTIVNSLFSGLCRISHIDQFSVRLWPLDGDAEDVCTMPILVHLDTDPCTWSDCISTYCRADLQQSPLHVQVVPLHDHTGTGNPILADVVAGCASLFRPVLVDVCIESHDEMHSFSVGLNSQNVTLKSLAQKVWNSGILHYFGHVESIVFEGGDETFIAQSGMRIAFLVKDHASAHESFRHRAYRPVLRDITNHAKHQEPKSFSTVPGAPLSVLAVLSSSFSSDKEVSQINLNCEIYIHSKVVADTVIDFPSDVMSAMQTRKPIGTQFKNAPEGLQNRELAQTFQAEQEDFHDDAYDSDTPDGSPSEGRSPSGESLPSEERPPSSEEGRQDVILYHLTDHPIRALINWNSYEDMITEIAHHYSLRRDEVHDAYEVVVSPPDIGIDVVPAIVHVLGDIPYDSTDRLVLIDLEYHAHRMEGNFRSGPNVVRSVRPIPMTASRDDVLYRANVDRYCRFESGRCLVFINSRRWPDYDVAKKTVAHGDYIRIALPPSEHFDCPTFAIADMIQQRFSNEQIFDAIYNDEAMSGASPSPLDEDEIRTLATPHLLEDDTHALMQNAIDPGASASASQISAHSDSSSNECTVSDWFIDLQRLVECHFQSCTTAQQEDFMFSVYTWFIDQETSKLCREPKIAILGDDPAEWRQDLLLPWEYHLVPGNTVLIDLVQPTPRAADVEDHIAHVILTQRPISLNSLLVSLEFVDESQPNVVVNFAAAVPKQSTAKTLADTIPLLEAFYLNRRNWIHPAFGQQDQPIVTRFGLGLHVQIFTEPHINDTEQSDEVSALMLDKSVTRSSSIARTLIQPADTQCEVASRIQTSRDSSPDIVLPNPEMLSPELEQSCLPNHGVYDNFPVHQDGVFYPGQSSLSLTDEFLRFVHAAQSAENAGGNPVDVPPGLEAQPMWVQDLWEKWMEVLSDTGRSPTEGLRIETWFTRPNRWSRCREPRIAILSQDFHHWDRELISVWHDKAEAGLPTQFAIVFPTPADADATVQEQVIIEQQSEPFSRSIVVTVYDTHIDDGRPHSTALVVSDRVDVRSLNMLMQYSDICPPEREDVECLLWMGNIAIHPDQVVNVRLGNAFRLQVRRGIRVTVQELLSMSDNRLRVELQSAISGVIYRRPNMPGFPADPHSNNNPETVYDSAISRAEYPPDWLNMLQERFDAHAQTDNEAEGPFIHVVVWFVNSGSFLRNQAPQVVRLDAESSWWRSELIFPWRDQIARGIAVELHCVDPEPPSDGCHVHSAHIIVSQALPQDHVSILATVTTHDVSRPIIAQAALVVHRFTSANNIIARFHSETHMAPGIVVRRGRNVFPDVHTVRVGSGDGIVVQLPEQIRDAPSASSSHQPQARRSHGDASMSSNDAARPSGPLQDDDLEDAMLMQGFMSVYHARDVHVSHQTDSSQQCAIAVDGAANPEEHAFQFNPAAVEFMPHVHVLPAWAQVIEDIYHDWDAHAFAWQGESRVTHFMTWFLAPGIQRVQCLYGRRIALMADFWNWREQFRHMWIDVIDPSHDVELVYVSPPPTQLEPGIVGHVIVIQHNSPEWSSMLVSVFDPAINGGHPFHMAHAFVEQMQFSAITARIGYSSECSNHAQCQFRVRGQVFRPDEWFRASDGDSVDMLVHRLVVPHNWYPPFLPHMPGAEGLALLQVATTVAKTAYQATWPSTKQNEPAHEQVSTTISLESAIGGLDDDIQGAPFTLGTLFSRAGELAHDLVVCAWEVQAQAVTIEMHSLVSFDPHRVQSDFQCKHALLKPCSNLFQVSFVRPEWQFCTHQWFVGSYAVPAHDKAIVACVEYSQGAAVARVLTLSHSTRTDLLRSVLSIKYGTFVRVNGQIVGSHVSLHNGDVLEYHVGSSNELVLDRHSSKVQLCLDASIETVLPYFYEDGDAAEVLEFPELRSSLCQEDGWEFRMIPEGVSLHKATFEALHVQQDTLDCPPLHYELYIDGATHATRSAWAVVAVLVTQGGRRLQGCLGGLTTIQPDSIQWIGAEGHTNIDAELSAMVIATAFAYFGSADAKCIIRPDLALSQRFLKLSSTTRKDSTLARVVHVLGQSMPPGIEAVEVRAHQGDPWNELADAIAKKVAQTGEEVGSVPWRTLHQIATSSSTLKWEWMRYEPPSFMQTMPVLHDGAVWQPTNSDKRIGVRHQATSNCNTHVSFSMKVATYNGLALNDEDQELGACRGRTARLDMQFHQGKIALVGIQEARTPAGQRLSDHYKIFSSGHQQCGRATHFGCELWIHKFLPLYVLADGQKVSLNDCKVTVVVQDSRLLVAKLQGPISFTAVVAHAPCVSAGRPFSQVKQWWEDLAVCVAKNGGDNIVVLIDANAPLADGETQFYGTHHAERMNPQGVELQTFLCTSELFAPSTFSTHTGPSATWRHPRGDQLRRDYVLLSKSFFPTCVQTLVWTDFDGGFGHVDHCPAICILAGILPTADIGKKFHWDFYKMQDPVVQKDFADAIKTMPLPSWTVNIDEHSALVETNLLQIAHQHFGKKKQEKSRPLLSAITLEGIQLKRQMLDMARRQGFDDPLLLAEIKNIEKILRPMVLFDQREWYARWLDGIDEAGRAHDTAMLYKKLQRLGRRKKDLGKGPRPLPKLRVSSDRHAQSYEECQQIWKTQFAAIESGIPVTDMQLQQLHVQGRRDQVSDAHACPDPAEILSIIRKFKNGKVPGPGQLPVDILKCGGAEVAKILTPLLVKASWHMREPLTWKGGLLIPLFKGKGSPADPSAYRSIFLSDVCAKVHHAHMRKGLADIWTQSDDLIQMGGRKGCSTDIAHHFLHAHLSWARANSISCGLLFVDLQAAFYSILRSSLFEGEFHDDMICFAMRQLGITPGEWHEIKDCVSSDNATEGLDAHRVGVLRDMFSGTHFSMHGSTGNIVTTRGTRPGDPVADILFNMAFRLVVVDARRNILQTTNMQCLGSPLTADDVTAVASVPRTAFAEITFVDDIAYAIHSDSPSGLVSNLQVIASCLHDAAAARGLCINYQAGKTEAVLKLAGTGSKAVKHRVWHECGGILPIVTEHGAKNLKIVHSYKHLGSYVQDHAVIHKDLRYRNAQAKKAYGQLSRQFYCKKNVGTHTKSSVFAALVMSRHCYNVHTWAWATEDDFHQWENGIKPMVASIAKDLIRPISAFQFSTVELCALIGLNGPIDQLHAARLRYVRRAIQIAPAAIWAFLHNNDNENSWLPHLIVSFQWLRMHLRPGTIPDLSDAVSVLNFIAIDPRWQGHVRAALKSCLRFHQARANGKLWSLRINHQVCRFADVSINDHAVAVQCWKCNLCDGSFSSKKALAVHARHKHQYRKAIKYYVLGDECLACGKKFFHRSRLLSHVDTSHACKNTYFACFVPASEEVVQLIEDEERDQARVLRSQGWFPSKAFLPMTRVQGPLLPECGTVGASTMKSKWLSRVQVIGRAYEGLDGYCEQLPDVQADGTEIVPFLFQSNGGRAQGEAGIFQQFGLAAETARLHVKGFVFVHFFSGFRRKDDLQHCIEAHDINEEQHVFCISVDLCLAKQYSDLTDANSKAFWVQKMKSGQVIGVGGGPSCETWSAARHSPDGPPPVRTYDFPWGKRGLSAKQWAQVNTGTRLVQFLVEMLLLAAELGLCGFLEHPQFPVWLLRQRPASVWTLHAMRVLARLACIQICSFDQCVFGLNARKPTTLMLLRLDTFCDLTMTRGNRGRCSHISGHVPLQGIRSDGSFQTAKAKIYPADMNRTIATAVSRFLTERQLTSDWTRLPYDMQELTCTDLTDEVIIQPDYHQ